MKINKIGDSFASQLDKEKEKKKRTQLTKTRNERGAISRNLTKIEKIIRECHEQLYAKEIDNLDKMENS